MAFNIKVYSGTSTSNSDLYNKIVNAISTIYGYKAEDETDTSTGWKVTKISSNKYILECKGEFGVDDMCYSFELGDTIKISGFMNYNTDSGALTTYGLDETFGFREFQLPVETQQFWIYGNSDFIHIITKGFGVSDNTNGAVTPQLVSFGKFIPTYNPAITNSTVDTIPQGGDIVIPVADASIFESDRYIIISSAYTFEKVLVTGVDVAGNTIRVANIVQTHTVVNNHPIIIGEIAKPYYVYQNYNTKLSNRCSILPHIGGNFTVNPDQYNNNQGAGVPAKLFTSVSVLAQNSALDRLNYDRYMFEIYLYQDVDIDQGFYGKLPFIYNVGSNNINSETTVINDNAYLYRCFTLYTLPQTYAFRESYK